MKIQNLSQLTLQEMEELARERMSVETWKNLGFAETGFTYRRNISAFGKIMLKQRVFHGLSHSDTSLELFGQTLPTPVLVAPIGSYSLLAENAEHDVLEGTMKAGSMLFVAHHYKTHLEELSKSEHPPMAWQGYFSHGFEEVKNKIKQAEALGFAAVGITVDNVQPVKLGDTTRKWRGPEGEGNSITIREIEMIRKETSLPLFVKGIMCKEDAEMAVEAGVDAMVVSNHGGRIADYSRSSIEALAEIAPVVRGKVTILVDSGFRRGTDILKALALGAKAVLLGRPVYWGTAIGGAQGVETVISKLTEELQRALVLCGVRSLNDLSDRILIKESDAQWSSSDQKLGTMS